MFDRLDASRLRDWRPIILRTRWHVLLRAWHVRITLWIVERLTALARIRLHLDLHLPEDWWAPLDGIDEIDGEEDGPEGDEAGEGEEDPPDEDPVDEANAVARRYGLPDDWPDRCQRFADGFGRLQQATGVQALGRIGLAPLPSTADRVRVGLDEATEAGRRAASDALDGAALRGVLTSRSLAAHARQALDEMTRRDVEEENRRAAVEYRIDDLLERMPSWTVDT